LTTSSVSYYTDSTGAWCAGENWGNNPQLIDPAPTGNPPACGGMPNAILSGQSVATAATVNQLQNPASTSGSASAYEAIAQPALAAVIPKVQRGSGWSDGFVVMNTSANNINVTVRLYNIDGSLNSTPINNQPLLPHQSLTVLNQIPNGFNGSALVTASGPVAVTANFYRSGITSGDVVGSQQAIHR